MTYAEEYYVYSCDFILCPPCVMDMLHGENNILRSNIEQHSLRIIKLQIAIERLATLVKDTEDNDKLQRLETILSFCK